MCYLEGRYTPIHSRLNTPEFHLIWYNFWLVVTKAWERCHIPATFRFQLMAEGQLIFSNQFEGSFNKEQLKNEQGHTPLNIMDPYKN